MGKKGSGYVVRSGLFDRDIYERDYGVKLYTMSLSNCG